LLGNIPTSGVCGEQREREKLGSFAKKKKKSCRAEIDFFFHFREDKKKII